MTTPVPHPALAPFTPEVREWFARAFAEPTPAQVQAWPAISAGAHALVSAPTGSGKTLAAFLWALDRFVAEPPPPDPRERTLRLVYISPLKALGYDVERNLRAPLRGIGADVRVGVRTGDTPQRERAAMLRHPPDVLITTPGIALPDAHVAGADAVRRHGVGDRRRDPRGGADQARRPPRGDPGAAGPGGGHATCSASACPPRSGRSTRWRASSSAPGASARSSTPACASRSTCASTCRWSPWSSPTRPLELDSIPGGEATRRSIWPAIYPELLRWSASTARRSSS